DGPAPEPPSLLPVDFSQLADWGDDDQAAAFRTFRRGAEVVGVNPPKQRAARIDPGVLANLLGEAGQAADVSTADARRFFERHFTPLEVQPPGAGFFTGYYEP